MPMHQEATIEKLTETLLNVTVNNYDYTNNRKLHITVVPQ